MNTPLDERKPLHCEVPECAKAGILFYDIANPPKDSWGPRFMTHNGARRQSRIGNRGEPVAERASLAVCPMHGFGHELRPICPRHYSRYSEGNL